MTAVTKEMIGFCASDVFNLNEEEKHRLSVFIKEME